MSASDQHIVTLKVNQLLALGMLEALDLELSSYDVCMLSGASGTGKSQFLKALADLISHQGEVCLNNRSQQEICPETWRSQVMYFAAETAWWADRVADHFEQKPATTWLAQIGLTEAMLEANPDTLSSGEKQRLALLRGLQYQPKVLLLDEITANLDRESEAMVEKLIIEYQQQYHAIVLWISHNPEQRSRLASKELCFTKALTDKTDAGGES